MLLKLRLCSVLSALFGCVLVSSARVGRATDNFRYGVILDAGSSSTKLHVYRWDQDRLPTKKADLTEVKVTGLNKIRPGISSYVSNPTNVKDGLQSLLNSAATVVPMELQGSTPVYLKATAGMRLLEPADVDAIFAQIDDLCLDSSKNPFKFERGWAKVISGEEEGVFGWISVNFLSGIFDSNSNEKPFGALDMGGASTQITFIPDGQVIANYFPLYIAGKRYDLYTNSFLKFGLDQFRLQMYQLLYEGAADKDATIDCPCDLAGYNVSYDIGDNKVAKIRGTSGPNGQCEVLVRQLLGLDDTCYTEPCSITGTYQPPVGDTVFFGNAVYFYAALAIGAVPDNGAFSSVDNIQTKTAEFCALSLAEATDQAGEFAFNQCLSGHFTAALLGDGYKLDKTANDKLFITVEIDDVGIGWALGSMLYELYLLNIEFTVGAASHVMPTSLALIVAMLTLASQWGQ